MCARAFVYVCVWGVCTKTMAKKILAKALLASFLVEDNSTEISHSCELIGY